MSLLFKNRIKNNAIIGVWEIDPSILSHSDEINLNETQHKRLHAFGTDRKKAEYLSGVLLIQNLLEEETPVEVKYRDNGRPFLEYHNYNISISHSGKFVAVLLSKDEMPGIDIEKVSDKIMRIQDKFMNEKELKSAEKDAESEREHKVVVWATKEALFKYYADGNLIFKDNLLLQPFIFEDVGTLSATIKTDTLDQAFIVNYQKIEDYVLVYVLG